MTRAKGESWPPSGFGPCLRREREKAGMSREQLAAMAGCAFSTVAKLEGGHQEPAWPLALALARALGVTVLAFVPEGTPVSVEKVPTSSAPFSGQPSEEKRPRGRPRKAPGVAQDATEAEPAPQPAPAPPASQAKAEAGQKKRKRKGG